jgi:transcriptional regulator with XRE-family HTH domain
MAIGERIQALRKRQGWSQQQLAKKIGTSGPIVGRYERGEMTPSVEVAKKLADTFDVTLDFLADDTGRTAEIKDKAMLQRIMDIQAPGYGGSENHCACTRQPVKGRQS